eukprot:gene20131-22103_t
MLLNIVVKLFFKLTIIFTFATWSTQAQVSLGTETTLNFFSTAVSTKSLGESMTQITPISSVSTELKPSTAMIKATSAFTSSMEVFITETSVNLQQSSSSPIETSALRMSSIAIAKATSSAPVASSSIVPSPSSSLAVSSSAIKPNVIDTDKNKSKLTTVHKALIGIACFVVLLIVFLIVYYRCYRMKYHRQLILTNDEIAAVPDANHKNGINMEDINHRPIGHNAVAPTDAPGS